MKSNTNTTITWNLPDSDLLHGVAKIPLIVGAIFVIAFSLFLIVNIAIEEARDFVRREIKQILRQQEKREVAPWESVSARGGPVGDTKVEDKANYLSAWKIYQEDLKFNGKSVEDRTACMERFQKDLAVREERLEEGKWRKAAIEAESLEDMDVHYQQRVIA